MVLTQVEELGCTASWSIRVFQISIALLLGFAGLVAGQTPTIGNCTVLPADGQRIALEEPRYHRVSTRGTLMIRRLEARESPCLIAARHCSAARPL
jgi:hypothetical protein